MNAQDNSTIGRPGEIIDPRSEPAPLVLQIVAIMLVLGVVAYVGLVLLLIFALQDWHPAF